MNPSWLIALAAAGTCAGSAVLWSMRQLVRQEVQPLRQDIEVLRVAVFNHLRHGGDPVEEHIREVLGYDPRQ